MRISGWLLVLMAGLAWLALPPPAAAQTTADPPPASAGEPQAAAADAVPGSTPPAAETAAREHHDAARQALVAGETVLAEEHYRQALALSPSPSLYLELIELLTADPLRTGDRDILWGELLAAFPDHPVALLANGDRLYAAGSYAAAAEAYARGARSAPRDPRFPHREGNCRYSLGEFLGAAGLYRRSLELEYDPLVVANLAGALAMTGKPADAQDTWQQYLVLHPGDAALVMQYGLALSNAGNHAAALEQFRHGQELKPDDDRFHNRAGLCLFQLGRLEEAVAEVQAAIALRPDPQYFANVTIGLEELGEDAQADDWYRRGLLQFPDNTGLLEAYATFLATRGDGHAALERLRALAEQTGSATAYARVADQARQLGEDGLAETAYLTALSLAPRDPALNVNYAQLLAALNRDEELLAHLRSVKQRLPDDDYGWLIDEVAAIWLDAEQYSRGAGLMARVIEQDPQSAVAYNALAMFQHLQEDGTAALETVKRGLNDAGDNYFGRYLEVYLTYAEYGPAEARKLAPALIEHPGADADAYTLYLELLSGHEDEATLAAVAQRGLEANPDSVELLELLATMLYNSGDNAGVIALLTDRRHARLDWAPRAHLLGLCYMSAGNHVKAAAELTTAVADSPGDAALWALLGQAQYFIGYLDEARTSLTHALAVDSADANAHLWLGYVLLDTGDAGGAQISFDAAAAVEYPPMDLPAWLALGRARAALGSNNLAVARSYVEQAEQYQLESPEFAQRLAETKAQAGMPPPDTGAEAVPTPAVR